MGFFHHLHPPLEVPRRPPYRQPPFIPRSAPRSPDPLTAEYVLYDSAFDMKITKIASDGYGTSIWFIFVGPKSIGYLLAFKRLNYIL